MMRRVSKRFRCCVAVTGVLVGVISAVPAVCADPRTAKVAGSFYPADPDALKATVTRLLEAATAPSTDAPAPRILIVPHAGYAYAGPIAARGFREIQGRSYRTVVVVGFTHRMQFPGVSVDDRESYETPLGRIPVNTELTAWLRTQPGLSHVERAHASDEHSLEVTLPFLQIALGQFQLVPILMGSIDPADAKRLADALAALAVQTDALFVFSTDLSHYHSYDEALVLDEGTVSAILFETPEAVSRLFDAQKVMACGRGPIVTSLFLAERLGYPQRRLLMKANSGDTTGDRTHVVGYAAVGMYGRTDESSAGRISTDVGRALVRAARQVLETSLKKGGQAADVGATLARYPELLTPHGAFVTLRKHGELRGCIGRITSGEPLASILPTITGEAAAHDPRFPPVRADELRELRIEVSVLTDPKPVNSAQEIVAGRDGVVLQKDDHTGVFLPQVWEETGWTRLEFFRELAHQKAGLDPEAWRQAQLSTFQAQAFEEELPPERVSPH